MAVYNRTFWDQKMSNDQIEVFDIIRLRVFHESC